MPELDSIIEAHNRKQDSLVAGFEKHLRQLVLRAQGRLLTKLQSKLSLTDDTINPTPANLRLLRNSGKLFMQELNAAGYPRLVKTFVGEFNQTLPFLQETLAYLGEQTGHPEWSDIGFTQADLNLLGAVQANTVAALSDAIQATAGAAVTRGLFGVAGLRFGSLVELLTDKLEASVSRAATLADTSVSVFYATASERQFAAIAKDLPGHTLRYVYTGPLDKITRPYCEAMLARTRKTPLTREEINEYPNGQIPNPFISRGGFRCRHQYVISVAELEAQAS